MRAKLIFIIILLPSFFIGCFVYVNNRVSYDKIALYVITNYELLEAIPHIVFNDLKKRKWDEDWSLEKLKLEEWKLIEKYLGKDTIVRSIYAYDENILVFYCGGSGMLNSSTYTGFYFSKENRPNAFEFGDINFVEKEVDVFEWEDEDRRHNFKTIKIMNNWYYYDQQYK